MLNPNDLRRYRETIAKSVVFEQLESGDVDLILSSCRLLDTAAGGFILIEGVPSDGLYIILEGQIEFLLPEHAGGRTQAAESSSTQRAGVRPRPRRVWRH